MNMQTFGLVEWDKIKFGKTHVATNRVSKLDFDASAKIKCVLNLYMTTTSRYNCWCKKVLTPVQCRNSFFSRENNLWKVIRLSRSGIWKYGRSLNMFVPLWNYIRWLFCGIVIEKVWQNYLTEDYFTSFTVLWAAKKLCWIRGLKQIHPYHLNNCSVL